MTSLPKDFVAASAAPIILGILSKADSYGYAIIREVEDLSGGDMIWADGMLYPILHRLEQREWVEAYWGKAETGRKRKYYRITKAGAAELTTLRTNWDKVHRMLHSLDETERPGGVDNV